LLFAGLLEQAGGRDGDEAAPDQAVHRVRHAVRDGSEAAAVLHAGLREPSLQPGAQAGGGSVSTPKRLYEGVGATQRVTPTDLPEYRLPFDRNRIPKTCGHCGSSMLDVDGGIGGSSLQRLVCVMCSSQLAWLKP
jgi:hypothetical protein